MVKFCSRDLTTIKIDRQITGGHRGLILSSVYLPYDVGNPPTRELEQLADHCTNSGDHIIYGCDANSHHEIWGSSDVNTRGEHLLEFLIANRLRLLNVGIKPTFSNRVRKEVIDITFCTESVVGKVEEWRVSNEPSLSDHSYITFKINTMCDFYSWMHTTYVSL